MIYSIEIINFSEFCWNKRNKDLSSSVLEGTCYFFQAIRGNVVFVSCSYSGKSKIVNNYSFSSCFLGEDKNTREIILKIDKIT